MPQKTEPRNLNDEEMKLIQATFRDNEALLKAIRALFFGLPTSAQEKLTIQSTFSNQALKAIMWRRFNPTLDRETPIGQVQDVWIGSEEMVFGQNPDTIYQSVMYKKLSIDMTIFALGLLEEPDMKPVYSLDYNPSFQFEDRNTALQVQLLARNTFIKHVEHQLMFLWVIAQQVPAEKSTKNSSK